MMTTRERLASGSVRGLGEANAVAAEALRDAKTLRELVAAVSDVRTLVTERAANALRKVQEAEPRLLHPYARRLVRCALRCGDLRTRWNLLQVIGRLPLAEGERGLCLDLLLGALESSSPLQRTFGMQGLVDLSADDEALRMRVRELVERALEDPSAAVRARARKLLPFVRRVARPKAEIVGAKS